MPVHKFVWADGNMIVSPDIQDDPGKMHHFELLQQMGYFKGMNELDRPENYVAGELWNGKIYHGHLPGWEEGEFPDDEQLLPMIQAQIGSHQAAADLPMADNDAFNVDKNYPW